MIRQDRTNKTGERKRSSAGEPGQNKARHSIQKPHVGDRNSSSWAVTGGLRASTLAAHEMQVAAGLHSQQADGTQVTQDGVELTVPQFSLVFS